MPTTILSGASVSPSGEPGSVGAIKPVIWSARLRSYNAIGNPNFELDQAIVGGVRPNIVSGSWMVDRWYCGTSGTIRFSSQQINQTAFVPNTGFRITDKCLRLTLTTAQASLGATDYFSAYQAYEGIQLRELANDATSVSILCRSSVANLKFVMTIRDPTPSKSICYLCTLGAADTFTLITLPNIPVFPSDGAWLTTPGDAGLTFSITLASGSNYHAPTTGAWQNGNFIGLATADNFASKPLGSTFDLAFVQHEPGNECSTLINKPWDENLDECQRFFQKTYSYDVAPGTVTSNGAVTIYAYGPGWGGMMQGHSFVKRMAKAPTVTTYNYAIASTGARGFPSAYNYSMTVASISDTGYGQISVSPGTPNHDMIGWHYSAHTIL